MDTTVTETARFSSDVSNNETPTPRGETSESWLGNITKELWLLQYRKCSADRPPSSPLWLHRLLPSVLLTPLKAHWPPDVPSSHGLYLHSPCLECPSQTPVWPIPVPPSALYSNSTFSARSSLPKIATSAPALPSTLNHHLAYYIFYLLRLLSCLH